MQRAPSQIFLSKVCAKYYLSLVKWPLLPFAGNVHRCTIIGVSGRIRYHLEFSLREGVTGLFVRGILCLVFLHQYPAYVYPLSGLDPRAFRGSVVERVE